MTYAQCRSLHYMVWWSFALLGCESTAPAIATGAGDSLPVIQTKQSSLEAPTGAGHPLNCRNALLDDLEDGDNHIRAFSERPGIWYTFKDSIGTTLAPAGDFGPTKGGPEDSKYAARMSGKMAEAGAGYAGMGFNITDPMAPYDLSKVSGFCFSAKGPGDVRLKVPDINTAPEGRICKNCYNDFGADFRVSIDWSEHCFRFQELKQRIGWGETHPSIAREKIFSLQWLVTTPGADYDVWVDNIRLFCD